MMQKWNTLQQQSKFRTTKAVFLCICKGRCSHVSSPSESSLHLLIACLELFEQTNNSEEQKCTKEQYCCVIPVTLAVWRGLQTVLYSCILDSLGLSAGYTCLIFSKVATPNPTGQEFLFLFFHVAARPHQLLRKVH